MYAHTRNGKGYHHDTATRESAETLLFFEHQQSEPLRHAHSMHWVIRHIRKRTKQTKMLFLTDFAQWHARTMQRRSGLKCARVIIVAADMWLVHLLLKIIKLFLSNFGGLTPDMRATHASDVRSATQQRKRTTKINNDDAVLNCMRFTILW